MEYDTEEKIAALSVIELQYLKTWQRVEDFGSVADTVFEHYVKIPMRDGRESISRIYIPYPREDARSSPVIVLLHGSRFIRGDRHHQNPFAKILTRLFNATVICLSYRLNAAHPFPAAPHDVEDGLKWIAENADTLDVDLSAGFIIGGPSIGANLAAVTAQKTVDGTVVLKAPLTGVWLMAPLLLEEEIVPPEYKNFFFAREQNAKDPMLNKADFEHFKSKYLPDVRSADYSPFNSNSPHVGMPRTHLQVGGLDFLRDDGLVYERALRAHNVETRLDVYPGAPHGYHTFFGVKSAVKANVDAFKGLRWLLKSGVSDDEIVKAVFPEITSL
ncbi:alpha/beta hydrolase fold-3 domain-containing protein [Colletotrichum orchidophilum]|uniref:Alpha/beta hydrolase fold-3 domain-containing protein n=1 Tax=Colletotrichum orchidophilum TaxID=1209926 RepID=A0A1G4BCD3_9PEZI|nr:alpha/beta hydrolase fold-3 domain-containing protein [Colletotrichum orchidophilum]OHE99030.1 alpha/beta hydrolase fold-3 domain-containing protein [Colletotrichum orchidophilum]